ncbi:MAG TPA: YfiR family protein [Ramlibacter sp.]|uniref:YfiR family protein n=1 Tax=Ramlibacter sp. TaxID=1917967 RepID=UPI002CE38E1B|nr:YfiR family protein [Ramlibacter sp.]HVZ44425.1 YfiR family protein [Ramlibacter sp.]
MPLRDRVRVLALAALLGMLPALAVAEESLEYQVKSAFLVRFADYVDWPASAFASPTAPFEICVAGEDPLGAALDKAAAGHQGHGHPMALKRLKAVRPDSGCHIVFIAAGEGSHADQQIEALQGAPVLTVTEAKSGATGIVNFVVKEAHVRFDIDDAAAMRNGLAISSKLLALALNVRPRAGAK